MQTRSPNRRDFLSTAGGGAVALVCGTKMVSAQAPDTVRVGYLHVLSVDAHLWLGTHLGTWERENLRIEPREFTTGIELFQALVGGSLDVLTTGGVLSNFPARGQGKVFLINDLEYATGQIWAHPGQGIHTLMDLKGRQVATTRGTTAHDRRRGSGRFAMGTVQWSGQGKISGRQDAGRCLGISERHDRRDGWAARNDFYENKKAVLKRFIRAWIPANDLINNDPKQALQILQSKYYPKISSSEVEEMYRVTRWYPTKEWAQYYRDGSVAKWLNQVTNFNVEVRAIQNPIMAEQYFDPGLYLDVVNAAAN
jgi:NitT/TauT family transport system substrate-binding protein